MCEVDLAGAWCNALSDFAVQLKGNCFLSEELRLQKWQQSKLISRSPWRPCSWCFQGLPVRHILMHA